MDTADWKLEASSSRTGRGLGVLALDLAADLTLTA